MRGGGEFDDEGTPGRRRYRGSGKVAATSQAPAPGGRRVSSRPGRSHVRTLHRRLGIVPRGNVYPVPNGKRGGGALRIDAVLPACVPSHKYFPRYGPGFELISRETLDSFETDEDDGEGYDERSRETTVGGGVELEGRTTAKAEE